MYYAIPSQTWVQYRPRWIITRGDAHHRAISSNVHIGDISSNDSNSSSTSKLLINFLLVLRIHALLILLVKSLRFLRNNRLNRRVHIDTSWSTNLLSINLLRFHNENGVRKRLLALSTWEFVGKDFDFDAQNTLTEEDVTSSWINKIANLSLEGNREEKGYRLARVNHKSIRKFHGFGSCSAKFARNNDFATLCTRFHNKSENTIAGAFNQSQTWTGHTVSRPIQPKAYTSNFHIAQQHSTLSVEPFRRTVRRCHHGIWISFAQARWVHEYDGLYPQELLEYELHEWWFRFEQE